MFCACGARMFREFCPSCDREPAKTRTRVRGEDVVAVARSLVGVPYRAQGRSAEGIDCLGILIHVFSKLGILSNLSVPQYLDQFEVDPDIARVSSSLRRRFLLVEMVRAGLTPFEAKDEDDLRPGDIACFGRGGAMTHIGVLSPGTVIHANTQRGMVVEDPYSTCKPIQIALFRVPGVES